MRFDEQIPANWDKFKQDLYGGKVFILPPSHASMAMVSEARRVFAAVNDRDMHPLIHEQIADNNLTNLMAKARRVLTQPGTSLPHIAAIAGELGAAGDDIICDVLRLRVMAEGAAQKPLPPQALAAHRDCWYANPQAQINVWVPIFDVTPGRSFAFYPHYFDRPIANTSGNFDYDAWAENVGFQSAKAHDASAYPLPTQEIRDPAGAAFAAAAGARVVFAASHLHQTQANATGLSRFSIDFRLVSRPDMAAGRGAPNVDNASRGRAEKDYHALRFAG